MRAAAGFVASSALGTYIALAVTESVPLPWEIGDASVEVRIETDPRKFHADLPFRWVRFEYIFEKPPRQLGRPPFLCHHRQDWARLHGGVDANETVFRVYIEGRDEDRTVILGMPRIRFHGRREPPLRGTHAACPPGGAQMRVRKLLIELDTNTGCFTDADGICLRGVPEYTLRRGDVEVFEVAARARRCYCKWTMDLPYYVGDDEHHVEITASDKRPFETSATSRATSYDHDGRRWYRADELSTPR